MGWPDTRLPVVVEIAPGAAAGSDPGDWVWTDVTTSAVIDTISIEAGQGDWGEDADPGKVGLTFNDPDGDFSEHNPAGQWYGQLGKDTPLRVRLRRVEDAFGRTSSTGWGTSDSGQAWEAYGAGGPVADTDASVSGGTGVLSVPVANGYRTSWLPTVALRDVEMVVTVSGGPPDVAGGPIEPLGVLLRHQDDLVTYYMVRLEVSAAEAVTLVIYAPDGTVLDTADTGLTWDATGIRVRAGITGQRLYGRAWAAGGAEPTGWQVDAVDDSAGALTVAGGVGVRAGVADTNTNSRPTTLDVDDLAVYVDLGGGWVPAWVADQDLSGRVRTVPATAFGALYRLKPASSKPPTLSPWRRTITSRARSGLLAYWPCEDDAQATSVASGLPGGSAMTAAGTVGMAAYDTDNPFTNAGFALDFGDSLLPGTAAGSRAVQLDGGGGLAGSVPPGTSSPVAWSVCWVARPVNPAGATYPMMAWTTPGGTYVRWEYRHANALATSSLVSIQADGTELVWHTLFDDTPSLIEYRVQANQDGADTWVSLYVAGVLVGTSSSAGTLARPARVQANPTLATPTALAVCHIQVWDHIDPPALGVAGMSDVHQPTDGYGVTYYPWQRHLNEAAQDRLSRLAGEDGVGMSLPYAVDGARVVRMGQQPDSTALDLYQECATADGGILHEVPFGLAYRPRASMYNQDPAITLPDPTALGAAPVPDGSDQKYRNRWTVRRSGGSSAVAELPDAAAGLVYDDSADVSLARDVQTPDQASWRLHLTGSRALRWPHLELNLWARPELLDAWLSCRIGDRITMTDPPADAAVQGVDVLLEGYQINLGYKDFRVAANCSPASSWRVAVRDTDRRDTIGSALAADVTAAATTISVATTAGPVWTQTGTHFPLDLLVGGERVTVGAIGQALNPRPFALAAGDWSGMSATLALSTAVVWASGYSTMLVTPAGGTSAEMRSNALIGGISAGTSYRVGALVNTPSAWASGHRVGINWYTSGGAFVSTSFGPATVISAGTWIHLFFDATAPATAGAARILINQAGTPTSGNSWYAAAPTLAPTVGVTTSPQSMTVLTRAVNGVSRAWPAGTGVRLADPVVRAL